jgi:glycosyltransferase involved in cell wall biosynthesis
MNELLELRASCCPNPLPSKGARYRPRVLHLINNFEIGGTERQAVELLRRLDMDRYDLRLAAVRHKGPLYSAISTRFPEVTEFPLTSFYNANAFRQFRRLRSWMVREEVDILHAHDFYAGVLGVIAAQGTGVKTIASQRHLRPSDRHVHICAERLINRLAHRVLVNSEAIRTQILMTRNVSPDKIVLIKNALRLPEQVPALDAAHDRLCLELGLKTNVMIVGMVAKLRPEKGHCFFIDAARRIAHSIDDIHFVLVGDGPLRHEIELQAKQSGIGDRVHLLGDRLDAAGLCAGFDVAVLASLREGFPNVILEAMGAGVPVVATAVGGVPEMIQHGTTGYLVPPADAEALAQQIAFALQDRTGRWSIAERGRRFVIDSFGAKKMVQAVQGLYDELMERNK